MKKIKQKLLPRSSDFANEDYGLNANSTRVRGSAYSGSTLIGGQAREAREESGPWGLKELCPGIKPIVE